MSVLNCYLMKKAFLAGSWRGGREGQSSASMRQPEELAGWIGKTCPKQRSASFCSENDCRIAVSPHPVKRNSAGGFSGIKGKDKVFGLLCRKGILQLHWPLGSGPHDLWERFWYYYRTTGKENWHFLRAKLLVIILKNERSMKISNRKSLLPRNQHCSFLDWWIWLG